MSDAGVAWEEVSPEAEGVSTAGLKTAVDYLEQNAGRDGVKELVVIRNGRLIWRGPEATKVHGVWSVTKVFTSTVLGLLIDDGKALLDTPAHEQVPALAETYAEVRLRHFTTMTSGYRAVGDEPRGTYRHGPSLTPFTPAPAPLFAPPGSKYAYWDSAMNQFGHVLTRIAGEPMKELFRRRIAEPIGMDPNQWTWGDFGEIDGLLVNGGSGNASRHVQISALELAKLGQLFLERGMWKGRRLISADWIDGATRVQVPADTPLGHPESGIDGRGVYGFNWWVNGTTAGGAPKWPGVPSGT